MHAFCCQSYALRYPQNVGKLILISPVGLPEAPWNTFAFEDDDVEARATLQFEQNELAADALQEQMMPASDPKVEAPTSPTLSRSSSNSRVQSGASSSSDTDGAPTDHFKRKEPPSASSEP